MKSMRAILALVLMASITVQADTFTISWTPPTHRVDGTPLAESELAKYSFYCDDTLLTDFQVIPGIWEMDITITQYGAFVCGLTVWDLGGLESDMSNTLTFTVGPKAPGPVTGLTIVRQVP